MTQKRTFEMQKKVLQSIEELSGLDENYFREGVVDVLKLLYQQDVTMTNLLSTRVDALESQLGVLKGFMMGLHLATVQQSSQAALTEANLRDIAELYGIDYDNISSVISTGTLSGVQKKIKASLERG